MTSIATRVTGFVLAVLGILEFFPRFLQEPAPVAVAHGHVLFHGGVFVGVFPTNQVMAGLLVVMGVWGLIASMQIQHARVYDRVLFTLAFLAVVIGFLPDPFNSVFGLLPLYGANAGLFFILAAQIFYFAFVEGPPMRGMNYRIYTP